MSQNVRAAHVRVMLDDARVIFHHTHVLVGPARRIHIPVLDFWQLSPALRDQVHVRSRIVHGSRGIARGILDHVHEFRARVHVVSNLDRVVSNLDRVVSNLDRVVGSSLTWSETSTAWFQTSTE